MTLSFVLCVLYRNEIAFVLLVKDVNRWIFGP